MDGGQNAKYTRTYCSLVGNLSRTVSCWLSCVPTASQRCRGESDALEALSHPHNAGCALDVVAALLSHCRCEECCSLLINVRSFFLNKSLLDCEAAEVLIPLVHTSHLSGKHHYVLNSLLGDHASRKHSMPCWISNFSAEGVLLKRVCTAFDFGCCS